MIESIPEIYASISATAEPVFSALGSAWHISTGFLSAYTEHLSCAWDKLSILFPIANFFDPLIPDSAFNTCGMNWDF